MGEPIRKTGAREDILHDFKKTHDNALAAKGVAADLGAQRLSPVLKIIESVKAQQATAQSAAEPLLATLNAADIHADKTIGRVSDEIWNDLGRPASDAAFDLLFPGGNAFYVDGDVNEQPDRMNLLVELLKANVHAKLSPAVAQTSIATIAQESAELRAAVEAARPARTQFQLLDRVLTAVARSAAIELANFKRLLKANGFSEADAHKIIPDRGASPAKKEAGEAPASPAPSGSTSSKPQAGQG